MMSFSKTLGVWCRVLGIVVSVMMTLLGCAKHSNGKILIRFELIFLESEAPSIAATVIERNDQQKLPIAIGKTSGDSGRSGGDVTIISTGKDVLARATLSGNSTSSPALFDVVSDDTLTEIEVKALPGLLAHFKESKRNSNLLTSTFWLEKANK